MSKQEAIRKLGLTAEEYDFILRTKEFQWSITSDMIEDMSPEIFKEIAYSLKRKKLATTIDVCENDECIGVNLTDYAIKILS